MFVSFEIVYPAAIETLLVAIPESVGLLGFGIGLVAIAVWIRSFLARIDGDKITDKGTKKGLIKR